MRAVLYCRVSTKDQVRNLSLATQEKVCRGYCDRNDYMVEKVFVEEGESAKSIDRTQLKRMLLYCGTNKGRINVVVVHSLSRFARVGYDHHVLRAALGKMGITLRSATEPIDDTSSGKFMENVYAAVAQLDNDLRSERTVLGMKARLEKGGWSFKPPLGYIKALEANGRKTVVPDRDRAHFITQAFELYSTGIYTKQKVLEIITRSGLTTRTGKPLSAQTLIKIFRNPFYAGTLCVPKWDVRQPSSAAALITPETFQLVQQLLDGKRSAPLVRVKDNPSFPLRHFVRCGQCNRPLTASLSKGRSKRYGYYRCQNPLCRAVQVRSERMEQLFVGFLSQLKPKPQYWQLFAEILVDVWEHKQEQAALLHKAAERQLASLLARKQQLHEVFIYQQAIDQHTYQEQLGRLNEEIASAEIEELEARVTGMDMAAAVRFAQFVLLNAPGLWTELPLEKKQRLQRTLFPRGLEFKDGLYGTAETSMVFYDLGGKTIEKEDLVAPTGIEPVVSSLKGMRVNRLHYGATLLLYHSHFLDVTATLLHRRS
jgi:site-specific DNA recombinase